MVPGFSFTDDFLYMHLIPCAMPSSNLKWCDFCVDFFLPLAWSLVCFSENYYNKMKHALFDNDLPMEVFCRKDFGHNESFRWYKMMKNRILVWKVHFLFIYLKFIVPHI